MMRVRALIGIMLCAFIGLNAQTSPYQKAVHKKDGAVLPYRILLPKNFDQNKKYPLLMAPSKNLWWRGGWFFCLLLDIGLSNSAPKRIFALKADCTHLQ